MEPCKEIAVMEEIANLITKKSNFTNAPLRTQNSASNVFSEIKDEI